MDRPKTYRLYKDNVFQLLFHDKERLLELYNALEDGNLTDTSAITVETLSAALYNRLINDLAFRVNDECLILTEHQSTRSENLPARNLLYLARLYEGILNLDRLHDRRLYQIPTPKFYVLYNGLESAAPVEQFRLSDSFLCKDSPPMLELTVKMINININSLTPNPILDKSPTLRQYGVLVQRVRENLMSGMLRDQAIEKAILDCISDNVLTDFLKKHGSEVANQMFREYTEEDIIRIRTREAREIGWEEGMEKGVKQGKAAALKESIPAFIALGREFHLSDEDILQRLADKFHLSPEEAQQYLSDDLR